jgi:FkbM family methyltransferase
VAVAKSLATRVLKRVWNHPGNRGQRLRALARALSWQVYKRTVRKPLAVEFAEGFSILCFPDSGSASNIFYGNHYFDLDEMNLMRRLLREGDGFIDGGANIGVYAMLAGSLVGLNGRVVAFEPFASHASRLRANAAYNRFGQVELRQAAVSDGSGTVSFVTNRDVSNRIQTRTDADADTIEVPCTTLDAALAGDGRFLIGKLDLEGSEIAALRGATRLLETANPPLWIVEWNPGLLRKRGHEPADLIGLLEVHGFGLVEAKGDRLIAAEPPPTSGNIIAAHRDHLAMLEERLRERPSSPRAIWRLPRRVSRAEAGEAA